MAISFRGGTTNLNNNAGTTQDYLDLSKPTGTVAGDFLMAMLFANDQDFPVDPPSGWTLRNETEFGSFYTVFFYTALAGASEPNFWHWDFGVRKAYVAGVLLAYSGVDPTNPYTSLKVGTSLGSPPFYGRQTPTASDQLMIVMAGGYDFATQTSVSWTSSDGTIRTQGHRHPVNSSLLHVVGADRTVTVGGDVDLHIDPSPATINAGGLYSVLLNPELITPVDLEGATSTSLSSAEGDLEVGTLMSGTSTSLSSASAAGLDTEGAWILAGTAASASSGEAELTVNTNHQIAGTSASVSDGVASLKVDEPPPYAFYEFFIDWNRDNGLRLSDFETAFDGWQPTDLLSLSETYSYSGVRSLRAEWQNQTPSPNPEDSFTFGDEDLGFDTGVFAITSDEPEEDEVLAITYEFSGVTIGQLYTLSAWIFVPVDGGQHVTLGVEQLVESPPTSMVGSWQEVVVQFTPTASTHTLFIKAHGEVTDGNFTYIDYVFITSEFENVTEHVRIEDVDWSYGRDQSRALSPVSPADVEIVLDNQDGRYSANNSGSPIAEYLLPNRELLIRATYRDKVYDLYRGYLDNIEEDPHTESRSTTFTALDPLGAVGGGVLSTEVWRGLRTGDAIHKVLDEIDWPENRRDIDPGASIIQYFWVEGQDAADAINDIVASEGPPAFATVSDAGYFVFRDRHHRLLQSNAREVQATFTADGQEPCFSPPADINVGWKDIINLVNLTAVPRSCAVTENEAALSPAPVVWEAAEGSTLSIPSGETITLKIDCDRPIVRFVVPEEKSNDFIRSGGNVVFTFSRESGQSTELTIQAPAEPVALTNLRVRGYAANDFGNIIVTVQDDQSVADVGPKGDSSSLEAPWVNQHDALAIGQIITRTRNRRLPTMSITVNNGNNDRLFQVLNRRLSDLIHIVEPNSYTDHDFYIESISHTIRSGGKYHEVTFGCEMVPTYTDPSEDEEIPFFTFGDNSRGFDTGVFGYDEIPTTSDDTFILDVSKLDEDGLGF